MRTLFQLSLVAALLAVSPAAFSEEGHKEVVSPDQRLVFKFTDADPDVPFGIFEKEGGKLLLKAPEDTVNSFSDTVACVWSPDSKQFALNFRAGGRYNVVSVFRWNGKAFVEQPSFEEPLAAKLDAEKAKQFKKEGFAKDAYQRRIWDSQIVRRWIDANTIEVDAYSIRAVAIEGGDSADISGSLRFQLRRDKRGKWKITKQTPVSLEEVEKNDG